MKVACVINNYNYADYLVDAIESARNQSTAFDKIVVVDDGSTDGSADMVRRRYGECRSIELIQQENRGQLAALNTGIRHVSQEIVCFLDADDVLPVDYVEVVLETFDSDDRCDFVFAAIDEFGVSSRCVRPLSGEQDLGHTTLLTAHHFAYWGERTSSISMRMQAAARLLPYPHEQDWRIEADVCLFWGAPLLGLRKRYTDRTAIRYRVHDRNNWHRRRFNPEYNRRRAAALDRLREHYWSTGDTGALELNAHNLIAEFCSADAPRPPRIAIRYLIIALKDLPTPTNLSVFRAILKQWAIRRGAQGSIMRAIRELSILLGYAVIDAAGLGLKAARHPVKAYEVLRTGFARGRKTSTMEGDS